MDQIQVLVVFRRYTTLTTYKWAKSSIWKLRKRHRKLCRRQSCLIYNFWWQIFFFFLGFFGFDLWCVEKGRRNSIVPNGIFLLSPQNLKFWICNGMVGLFWSSGKVPLLDRVGLGSIPSGPKIFFQSLRIIFDYIFIFL